MIEVSPGCFKVARGDARAIHIILWMCTPLGLAVRSFIMEDGILRESHTPVHRSLDRAPGRSAVR